MILRWIEEAGEGSGELAVRRCSSSLARIATALAVDIVRNERKLACQMRGQHVRGICATQSAFLMAELIICQEDSLLWPLCRTV